MEKMNMQTKNKAKEKFERFAKLFPNAITESIVGQDTEGKNIIERSIDADILRQEISDYVIEGKEERYQFTWPDKKKSMLLANSPINATLRPIYEDSINFDTTENLYIEGDNLDVLKLLQETYLGKIKMIYIDPPYNTGNDFVYEDDFAQSMEEYQEISGQYDEEGNRLFQNTERNGRYHTDWLNMMYPRLKLARDLLSDDGVIFISIDDNEAHNLRKICDEIYGSYNFIATFMWKRKKEISSDSKNVAIQGENIICYSKSVKAQLLFEPLSEAYVNKSYNNPTDEFPEGKWRPVPITVSKGLSGGGYTYEIITPTGIKHTRLWAYPEKSYEKLVNENRVYFGKEKNGIPQRIMYAHESKGQPISNYWDNIATNKEGKKEILNLFIDNIFDTPKPVALIAKMLKVATDMDSIIIDFFSGSATTAHAVMELNAIDGGNRKYIMVQIPEEINEKSEAYKAGYKNICEIGKERIRRAAKKIREGNPDAKFDDGFRVLKLDSSNMKDVYYKPHEIEQNLLDLLESNIKEDRISEDLLFQVMLDLGVLLSSPIVERTIEGKKVYSVAEGFLMACFDKDISDEVVKSIAMEEPYYAVFKDNSMKDDSTMSNFDQIFETYSPSTIRKVL